MSKVTSERSAKDQQERAMEMLREVREWVGKEQHKRLPPDSTAPVTRHQAEAHAAYAVWYFTLRDAMHSIDSGYDEQPPRGWDATQEAGAEALGDERRGK